MGKKFNDPSIPSGLGQVDGTYLLAVVHPTTGKIYRVPASIFLGLFNTQLGNYTLALSDWGKNVEIDSSSAVTVTVPSGLPANFFCTIIQKNTGAVTIAAGSGTTLRGGLTLGGQNAVATIMARALNDFYVLTGGTGSGTTGGTGATQLNAPTGLAATSISPTQINLAWTDTNTTPNESGYKIFRNTVNTFSTATQIGTAAANAVAYNDTAVPAPGTLYYYWSVASGDGTTTSDSSPSASSSATSGSAPGTVLFTENFEGVTPPAIPTTMDYENSGNFSTLASDVVMGSNMIYANSEAALPAAYTKTIIETGTGVSVSADLKFNGSSGDNALFLRANQKVWAGINCYLAEIALGSATGIKILKKVSGTASQLGSTINLSAAGFTGTGKYNVAFGAVNSGGNVNLTVYLTRATDGFYWNPGTSTWQAGQVAALTYTDSTSAYQTAGYDGFWLGSAGSSNNGLDNFKVTT